MQYSLFCQSGVHDGGKCICAVTDPKYRPFCTPGVTVTSVMRVNGTNQNIVKFTFNDCLVEFTSENSASTYTTPGNRF